MEIRVLRDITTQCLKEDFIERPSVIELEEMLEALFDCNFDIEGGKTLQMSINNKWPRAVTQDVVWEYGLKEWQLQEFKYVFKG